MNRHYMLARRDGYNVQDKRGIPRSIKPDLNSYYRTFRRPVKSITNHCVVLDLDESLVSCIEGTELLQELEIMTDSKHMNLRKKIFINTLTDCLDTRGTGVCEKIWGMKRPYLDQFIKFCFTYFRLVIVWTAGKPRYATALVDVIFKDTPSPDIIYDSKMIITVNEDGEYAKPLENIFITEGITNIASLKNTFLVDDKADNSITNPCNAIVIPRFTPDPTIEGITNLEKTDKALRELMEWLMRKEVIQSKDIRRLDKSNIFTQKADQSTDDED